MSEHMLVRAVHMCICACVCADVNVDVCVCARVRVCARMLFHV